MPYELRLSQVLKKQRWKVKIFDKESLWEEPHVSVICKTKVWRWSLREQAFMNSDPDPNDVPASVVTAMIQAYEELCTAWDELFPRNPVQDAEEEDQQL